MASQIGENGVAAATRNWVWVFGEIEGLRWVLDNEQMAFGAMTPRASTIGRGDRAILYSSRGAFHNPQRDESRLVGVVQVEGEVHVGEDVEIAGRTFSYFVPIRVLDTLPERMGPSARALVPKLDFVARKKSWGQYFRSSPIQIDDADFDVMAKAIRDWEES